MRIYVTGSVGSGKSTYARRLSQRTGIPCVHLDEVVYEPDASAFWGNRKRPVQERDARFAAVIARKSWIIEDAGRACFEEGMARADRILVLDYPLPLRQWRIIRRWVCQRLGLEKSLYRPRLKMLRLMLRWARDFDDRTDGARRRIARYEDKVIRFTAPRAAQAYAKGEMKT